MGVSLVMVSWGSECWRLRVVQQIYERDNSSLSLILNVKVCFRVEVKKRKKSSCFADSFLCFLGKHLLVDFTLLVAGICCSKAAVSIRFPLCCASCVASRC